ncbi:GAF domain-containing sensor histidine kinase [Brachybacterium sacelli]|uniref:Signal transduction histidine kinase n=1 Tax=Brachybacterium sacelli TaxID=173364 RepID=A0ABS4X667_9MICO|nr:histidine kinase [Brachybacterium sacelli]MBP2383959.1 signal transduction histidine kinase [Brachybacterium sacelli]
MTTTTPPPRADRPRVQDLAGAVLAGGDTEDLLDLLVRSARTDLDARSASLVLPLAPGVWAHELVDGLDAAALLGAGIDPSSPAGRALEDADADALEEIGSLAVGEQEHRALLAVIDAAEHGVGVLAVLRGRPEDPSAPFTAADRERLDALAGLIALTLRAPTLGVSGELDDERSRIARDLHDLAIQELFAVGMELEGLTDALSAPGEPPSNTRIRTSVAASVQGVENAVAQIRQIVQSLRRERLEATLTEQLRHEVGLAAAGLGFVPALRLPPHPAEMDAELPAEIAEDVVAVVREGLANAARHAHASAVAVSVSVYSEGVDRVVQINVSDNGRGIDPSVQRRSGLANMSSRARRHSGWVDAISLEPGTMISWRVTLPAV